MSPTNRSPRDTRAPGAPPDGRGLRLGIVVARFNTEVTSRLLIGAEACLEAHGVAASERSIVHVPGAWEIPLAAGKLAGSGRYDALVALGALIRGETLHFEVLAHAVARDLGRIALSTSVPIGFGVLTTETVEQALERSGAERDNKGWEAALSALEMASLLRGMR